MPNLNFLGIAVLELAKASTRAEPGWAGLNRVGPCHIKNGLYMKKEEFCTNPTSLR